jgi:hypothetical protein
MSFLQKITGAFFGVQIGMLSLMTLLAALHDHPFLQILALGALAFVGVQYFKGRSRAARAEILNASNTSNPAANAVPAQPAPPVPAQAPAPAQARARSPVYVKSSVVAFKSQP